MLTIPNSIKTLYKTDGVRKNFRVQFPNGELPDITNDNIVRESVHFTESICSQSTFRFGLAEASVIEFETVGIPNMYGYTIECAYEIDTSSLSASEIASIQSDPGDGELVLASASDIGYGFYRVPLGVFRVERCPRNHGAMTHRQVTAYGSGGATDNLIAPFEKWKQQALWKTSIGTQLQYLHLDSWIDSNLGHFDPSIVAEKYTKSNVTSNGPSTFSVSYTVDRPDGSITISGSYTPQIYYGSGINTPPRIFSIEKNDFTNAEAKAFVAETLQTWGIGDSTEDVLYKAREILYATIRPSDTLPLDYVFEDTEPIIYYPDNSNASLPVVQVEVPKSATISLEWLPTSGSVQSATQSFTMSASGMPFRVYRLTPLDTSSPGIAFNNTGEVQRGLSFYSYANSYSVIDILNGYAEISGQFWKDDRTGSMEIIELDQSSPLAISPGDYDEVWWDEYDVSPIGTVTVTYRNGEEGEATANVTLGAGASLYDMTDNEVLKNLSTADLDSITTLLSGDFAANAQNVGFTPVEMTMQGWPWMEAGDSLQITAEDGTVVNTYALRVEMSGIQHLMSDITAEGGEIIGEV